MSLPGLVFTNLLITSNYDAPGSNTFSTPGVAYFTVPNYSTNLIITLWGGGCAGKGRYFEGKSPTGVRQNAGYSTNIVSLSLYANGAPSYVGGDASGGDTNLSGNNGTSPGGTSGDIRIGATGWNNRGNGGNGEIYSTGGKVPVNYYQESGGAAGKLIETYAVGALTPGSNLELQIGQGGIAESNTSMTSSIRAALPGSNGYINITWT